MPHITVQMFPGRNDEIKKNLAEKLANQHIMSTIENMDRYGWDNLLK